jgi:mono/diheme cytochrome c family protein
MGKALFRPKWVLGVTVIVVLAGLLLYGYWYYLQRDIPIEYADPEEHFKYASFGAEKEGGVPYLVWQVMPEVCTGNLPGDDGYASLGFIYEPGHETPVGLPLRTIGIPRIGLNCATCHTGTVRLTPQGETRVIATMPSHQLNLQGYLRFLGSCAADERFTPANVLAAIKQENDLSFIDTLVYRYLIIPATKKALLELGDRFSWGDIRPDNGPGRIDTLAPYKELFGFDLVQDKSIGTADFMSLWNQGPRATHWANWDGNNNAISERNRAAALGTGATIETLDVASIARMETWIRQAPAPAYPYPIDTKLAAQGEPIFEMYCGSCHDFDGEQVGEVVPIEEIGTDRHRFDSQTQELADKVNTIGAGTELAFAHFRKSTGYLNTPLDGIWARAPYLHNGSVPGLVDLLEPPENRPAIFYRGYNVYDPEKVGFVSSGPEAEQAGFRFDTSVPGNGNGGHLYGIHLSPAEKTMLIEYLKQQ